MYVVAAPHPASIKIMDSQDRFPIHRIYCVGRNYAEHAREMGHEASRDKPIFFMKPADAVCQTAVISYPVGTNLLHHEVEWVVALGIGGSNISVEQALSHVYGYAIGLDLTRRDLQIEAKSKGQPWDLAKGFDNSAPISPLIPATVIGHPQKGRLTLKINGLLVQSCDIQEMIFSVPEIISSLSQWFELKAGDLIFTGTPQGVGPLNPGDLFVAHFSGMPEWSACISK
jgi:fumarylpyruvate hydrolase